MCDLFVCVPVGDTVQYQPFISGFVAVHLFGFCTCSSHLPDPASAPRLPRPSLRTSAGWCCASVPDPETHRNFEPRPKKNAGLQDLSLSGET